MFSKVKYVEEKINGLLVNVRYSFKGRCFFRVGFYGDWKDLIKRERLMMKGRVENWSEVREKSRRDRSFVYIEVLVLIRVVFLFFGSMDGEGGYR